MDSGADTLYGELGGNDVFERLLAGMTFFGRAGEVDEVGGVIAGLPSDKNRWKNAQDIDVSGGTLI